MIDNAEQKNEIKTLETEVKEFVSTQPYWANFICSQILSGIEISDEVIETAFSYLLEELGLKELTHKSDCHITYKKNTEDVFFPDVRFVTLRDIEGVNALSEKQTLEITPNLTVVYGANGSGKTGYVRLFKNSFYSRDKKPILPNINNNVSDNKPIIATFQFFANNSTLTYNYPNDLGFGVFSQFAVFDSDIGRKHLTNRNDFSFRPAGLKLFNDFNLAIEKINTRLNSEIQIRSIANPFAEDDIFQGKSIIKDFLIGLSKDSNIMTLKSYLPFTKEDEERKLKLEKQYDDMKINLAQKEKALKDLRIIYTQLNSKKDSLEKINTFLSVNHLIGVNDILSVLFKNDEIAKREGVEKFNTNKINNIGSVEWKNFIFAAERFAKIQNNKDYPTSGDNCLLCHQPLESEASTGLIKNYWVYIKSVAEQELKTAKEHIIKVKQDYEQINFNLFPQSDVLTAWFLNNDEKNLDILKTVLNKQQLLCKTIIECLCTNTSIPTVEILTDLSIITCEKNKIEKEIQMLEENEQNTILEEIQKEKVFLSHKEKLESRFSDIKRLYENILWIDKANAFNKQSYKTQSTKAEKKLSFEYFNKNYISAFNEECHKLNGEFGIEIDSRSTDAQSNRQLLLKGKDPSSILSEGEQKVIELADFIAETNITEINKGVIFDDPVTSLDDERKTRIAERFVQLAQKKQVLVFTHDLAFVSSLVNYAKDYNLPNECHWIENRDGAIGRIWPRSSPYYESSYRNAEPVKKCYSSLIKVDCPPEERVALFRNGFAALRTCYEVLVIQGLFCGVVQRYNERISIDSLKEVKFTEELKKEVISGFTTCCSYMEGHSHTDKSSAKKIDPKILSDEITKYEDIRKKIGDAKKAK